MKSAMLWSGGKDSSLALHRALNDPNIEVAKLLCTITQPQERVTMHGVPKELIARQATSMGIPWQPIYIPASSDMQAYETAMAEAFADCRKEGITHLIAGDIFLEDLKAYRDEQFKKAGLSGHYPLWKEETATLLQEFITLGFKGLTVCVEGDRMGETWVGRELDSVFKAELPEGIDPCGENGEFHSFVWDGPIFQQPVDFERGEKLEKVYEQGSLRKAFWFLGIS